VVISVSGVDQVGQVIDASGTNREHFEGPDGVPGQLMLKPAPGRSTAFDVED
jgi:hypothetical protein